MSSQNAMLLDMYFLNKKLMVKLSLQPIMFDFQNDLKTNKKALLRKKFEKVMIAYLFLSSAIRLDFLSTRNLNIVLALDVSTIAISKSQVR